MNLEKNQIPNFNFSYVESIHFDLKHTILNTNGDQLSSSKTPSIPDFDLVILIRLNQQFYQIFKSDTNFGDDSHLKRLLQK